MESLCPSCGDVSNSLHKILTSELDIRTGIGKIEYTWKCDASAILQAAARGCTFCAFIKYVFLQPYYDPQSLGPVPWRAASKVDDLTRPEFFGAMTKIQSDVTGCLVCSSRVSKGDAGVCYRCRPRITRYVAANQESAATERGATGILPMSIAIRKASWALDENTDVEGLSLSGHMGSSNGHPLNTNEKLFRVDCSGNDPTAAWVNLRPRLNKFDDPKVFQQVRSLLQKCAENHDCGPDQDIRPENRPTRLLELDFDGTSNTARLSSGTTSEPYVALSYCWGGRQSLLTKKANLEEHKRSILVSELAQSIQDAIHITRSLGVRYLWIDCLCIVQDDKQDKSREIGKMRNVYANSYLTICAGRAKAAADGFLGLPTDPFTMDAAAVATDLTDANSSSAAKSQSRNTADISGQLPVVLPEGKIGQVNIRRGVEYSSAMEPLVARAWTYEERLLSKRIVTFGQCITWRCLDSHCLLAETGDHWYPDDEENVTSVRGEPNATALQPKRLLSRWHDLVTAYSTRSMYDEGDKLPAIAGIVQQIQPDGDSSAYLAGLWRSQLADDLLWCMPQHGTTPSQWRAPSWSWASLNGLVKFQDAGDVVQGSKILISDLFYDVQLDSEESPFGELRSASLYLTGRIGVAERGLIAHKSPHGSAPTDFVEILCDPSDPATTVYQGTSRLKIDHAKDFLKRSEDEKCDLRPGETKLLRSERVWCLPIHGTVEYEPDESWDDDMLETRMDGLLLRQMEHGSYRRIGTFEVSKYDDGGYFTWSEPGRIHLI